MFRILRNVMKFCSKKPSEPYIYPFNINQQEQKSYITKVQRQLEIVKNQETKSLIPRRKRRIYATPKFDTDLTYYDSWRVFGKQRLSVLSENIAPVVCKIKIQPKWLIHAFGEGYLPQAYITDATQQFYFQDNNFSKYLLYDFRSTTQFTPNVQGYDYNDQSKIRPSKRKTFRPTYQEFWASQQYYQFRLNASLYAEHHKFKKWLLQTLQKRKSEPSYDEFINNKFGSALCFNRVEDHSRYQRKQPLVQYANQSSFNFVAVEKVKGATIPSTQKTGKKQKKKQVQAQVVTTPTATTPKQTQQTQQTQQILLQFSQRLSDEFRVVQTDTPLSYQNTKKTQDQLIAEQLNTKLKQKKQDQQSDKGSESKKQKKAKKSKKNSGDDSQ